MLRCVRFPQAGLSLCVCLLILLRASSVLAPQHTIQANAPFQVVASGLHDPTGLALDPTTGNLYLSEAQTGVIARITPAGAVQTVVTGFKRPSGLAYDPHDGSLLVVDEQAGTLKRIAANGAVATLRSDLDKPHWVAVAADGTIILTAQQGAGFRLPSTAQGVLLHFAPDGTRPQLLLRGLKSPEGLRALSGARLRFLAERLQSEPERGGGTLFQLGPDGFNLLVRAGFKKPHDVALDALEATYLSAERQHDTGPPEKGVLARAFSLDGVDPFATGLKEPQGLAFDAQGNLYVAEREMDRVLKFLAPAPPTLDAVPAFTNQATLTLTGAAAPNALVTVRGDVTSPLPPQADVSAQVTVQLSSIQFDPATETSIQGITITNNGPGPLAGPVAVLLTSIAPPEITLANASGTFHGHPFLAIPVLGGFLRPGDSTGALLRFTNRDQLLFAFTHQIWTLLPTVLSDTAGHFSLSLRLTPNASNGLEVFATAALGRGLTSAPATTSIVQDEILPDTQITSGPSGEISATTANFTFTGTDNLTPGEQLVFAWALDGAPFTAFQPAAPVTLRGLAAGAHTFRVKARDLAGNEDPTPAERPFRVSLVRVTITAPVDGAIINANRVTVRGTVSAAAGEVGVVVNGIPALVNNGQWAVEVTLQAGRSTLVATATDSTGAQGTASITVTVPQATPAPLILQAVPTSGVSPLTVTFTAINQTGRTLVQFEFDPTGSGTFAAPTPSFDGITATYTRAGLVFPALRARDAQGVQYTAATAVNLLDRHQTDGVLQAKWAGLKAALTQGDVPAGLAQIHRSRREAYAALFSALGAQLPALGADMPGIEPVYFAQTFAKYRLRRLQRVGGAVDTVTYYLYFSVDEDGLWRLQMF